MIFSGNYRYFRLPWVIRMLIFNDATHPSYLSGPMDTQKVKVQFSSWPQISRWSVQTLCVRYTLGARYLYFKRNAEKFGGACYRSENTVATYFMWSIHSICWQQWNLWRCNHEIKHSAHMLFVKLGRGMYYIIVYI
jgi:hypothetical protein